MARPKKIPDHPSIPAFVRVRDAIREQLRAQLRALRDLDLTAAIDHTHGEHTQADTDEVQHRVAGNRLEDLASLIQSAGLFLNIAEQLAAEANSITFVIEHLRQHSAPARPELPLPTPPDDELDPPLADHEPEDEMNDA